MSSADETEHAVPHGLTENCSNCGYALRGPYCAGCGQSASTPDRLTDIVVEWCRAVLGTEGILWGTLALLIFDPGKLTREWWEGKRVGRMSPVRVLLAVMFLGSVVAWGQSLIFSGAGRVAVMIQVFTYQTAIVGTSVTLAILPKLLPPELQRSTYQHATFALYESAFLALVALAFLFALLLSGVMPANLAHFGSSVAPLVVPVAALAVIVHVVCHLKTSYGMTGVGAVVRATILVLAVFIASAVASVALSATLISDLWVPR